MSDDTVKRLSWRSRGNDANSWSAWVGPGRYLVTLHNGHWHIEYQPFRPRRRQLGMATTADRAKAAAQADYDHLAREKIRA